jgi:hypothetical protein
MRILGRPLNRWHKNVEDRKIMMRRKRDKNRCSVLLQ